MNGWKTNLKSIFERMGALPLRVQLRLEISEGMKKSFPGKIHPPVT